MVWELGVVGSGRGAKLGNLCWSVRYDGEIDNLIKLFSCTINAHDITKANRGTSSTAHGSVTGHPLEGETLVGRVFNRLHAG